MIYLFSGENTFEIERLVKELAGGFEGEVQKVDGSELELESLPDLLSGVTLFSSSRLVIIKDASQNKTIWAALGEWLEKGVSNDIALVEKNPDKRTKTYKWLQKHGKITTANELKAFEVARWLMDEAKQLEVAMGRSEAEFLVEYLGLDQWILLTALTKLSLNNEPVTREVICQLIEPTPQATSFELLDAAFAGRHDLLQERLAVVSKNEDPYMFFGLLASQVYAIALMQSAGSRRLEDVAKEAGVHPFVLKKVSLLASQTNKKRLSSLVSRLAELDENLKSRPVEPWAQIQSFLISLS